MSIVINFAAAADGANASLSSKSCVGEAFTAVKLNKKKTNTFVNNFKICPLTLQPIEKLVWVSFWSRTGKLVSVFNPTSA